MSDQGLSIFDDQPEDDADTEASTAKDSVTDTEKTQVIPVISADATRPPPGGLHAEEKRDRPRSARSCRLPRRPVKEPQRAPIPGSPAATQAPAAAGADTDPTSSPPPAPTASRWSAATATTRPRSTPGCASSAARSPGSAPA